MALANFSIIRRMFGDGLSSETEKRELFKEALLMTLARGTSADSYTDASEVEAVCKILAEHLDEEVSVADIRIAARSDLYEAAPLEKWLTNAAKVLDESSRKDIVKALVEVIRVDGHIRSGEADFFNMVVAALNLTACDVLEATL